MKALASAVVGLALAACAAPAPVVVALPPIAATAAPVEAAAHVETKAPSGYVECTVLGMEPAMQGGSTLMVGPAAADVVLPIFIGGSEAVSIEKRRNGERFERPLTHDLLDAAVRELGGKIVKAHVESKRGVAIIGAVFLQTSTDRVVTLDARASDAIALALGNRVPIYCSQRLLEQEGVKRKKDGE